MWGETTHTVRPERKSCVSWKTPLSRFKTNWIDASPNAITNARAGDRSLELDYKLVGFLVGRPSLFRVQGLQLGGAPCGKTTRTADGFSVRFHLFNRAATNYRARDSRQRQGVVEGLRCGATGARLAQ